ncbi:MAG: VCBS repeat-containing protein, partial [Verrucomicrobiota bacterium]
GDFNGDGKADFLRQERGALADDVINSFNIFLSKGTRDGIFDVVTPTNDNMQGDLRGSHHETNTGVNIILGDYNGDGKTDFLAQQFGLWASALGGGYGQDIRVYFSDFSGQTGTFNMYEPTDYGMGGSSRFRGPTHINDPEQKSGSHIIPGDFNGDGMTDFIRQSYGDNGGWTDTLSVPVFEVFFSTGNGEFRGTYSGPGTDYQKYLMGRRQVGIEVSLNKYSGVNIVTGDYNGDGRTDFVAQRYGEWAELNNEGGWRTIQVYLSKGDGNFDVRTPFENDVPMQKSFYGMWSPPGNKPYGIFAEFFQIFNNNSVSYSANHGTFLIPADCNGDGRMDLIRQEGSNRASGTDGTFKIFLSKGDGSFDDGIEPAGSPYQSLLKGHHKWSPTVYHGVSLIPGDYDGDGRMDFLSQRYGRVAPASPYPAFGVYLNPDMNPQPQETIKTITQGKVAHEVTYGLMTELDVPIPGTLTTYYNDSTSGAAAYFAEPGKSPVWLVTRRLRVGSTVFWKPACRFRVGSTVFWKPRITWTSQTTFVPWSSGVTHRTRRLVCQKWP